MREPVRDVASEHQRILDAALARDAAATADALAEHYRRTCRILRGGPELGGAEPASM